MFGGSQWLGLSHADDQYQGSGYGSISLGPCMPTYGIMYTVCGHAGRGELNHKGFQSNLTPLQAFLFTSPWLTSR